MKFINVCLSWLVVNIVNFFSNAAKMVKKTWIFIQKKLKYCPKKIQLVDTSNNVNGVMIIK